MNVSSILLTVNCHTSDSHFSAGSKHSDGNLTSVGHQNFLDRFDVVATADVCGGEVVDPSVGEVGGDWPPPQPGQCLETKHVDDF